MEKMRPLDAKLKYQIDRLVQAAELSAAAPANETKRGKRQAADASSNGIKPRVAELLAAAGVEDSEQRERRLQRSKGKKSSKAAAASDDDDDDDDAEDDSDASGDGEDDDNDDDDDQESGRGREIYKVPKRSAVPYQVQGNTFYTS